MYSKSIAMLLFFNLSGPLAAMNLTTNEKNLIDYAALGYQFKVATLLRLKTMINCQDVYGKTPLHHACHNSKTKTARLLIHEKADVNCKANDGWMPLHDACHFSNNGVVKLLLQHNADLNAKTKKSTLESAPLHCAITSMWYNDEQTPSIIQSLIDHGADLDCQDYNGFTPLHSACQQGYYEVVQLLLKYKANVNAQSNAGWTSLHVAVSYKHDEEKCRSIIQELVNHGASLHITNENRQTPLKLAEYLNNNAAIKIIENIRHSITIK